MSIGSLRRMRQHDDLAETANSIANGRRQVKRDELVIQIDGPEKAWGILVIKVLSSVGTGWICKVSTEDVCTGSVFKEAK